MKTPCPRNRAHAAAAEAGVPAFIQHGHTFGGRLGSGAVESVGITRLPAFGVGAGMGEGGTKPSSGEETKVAPACASSSAPSILHEG